MWRIVLIIGVAVLLGSCYVSQQGAHFLSLQLSARDPDRLRERGRITPSEVALVELVADIRAFGQDRLGLKLDRNYTRLIQTDRSHVVDVVSAAGELTFERKTWWFPIVGRVPYRGYYRLRGARRLAKRLDRNGWDVIVRPAGAFSTLGYFRDPLYSFMADYSVARMAELILHESAHATVWIASNAQFNEEFATLVGRKGAEVYLADRFGTESQHLIEYRAEQADAAVFRTDVLALRDRLQAEFTAAATEEAARQAKARAYRDFQAAFRDPHYQRRYRSDVYRAYAEREINNAFVDLFVTYENEIELHSRVLAALDADVRAYVRLIAEIAADGSIDDPYRGLHRFLETTADSRRGW